MTQNHIESLDDLFNGLDNGKTSRTGRQPFKFLDPYGPEDRDLFFGRELEIAELYRRFYISPLLLVYGESGSGKTSLVQCGLQSEIPVEDAVFYTIRSAVDPLAALHNSLLRDGKLTNAAAIDNSTELLREISFARSKTLVLFFDQFEEFFLFQPEETRKQVAEEMATWLDSGIDLRIIISIREEYYARLSELETVLPTLYDNRLWVRKMSTVQAEEVITGPCRACGITISEELVKELTGELGKEGKGVELPILQVILDTLYNQAIKNKPDKIRLSLADYHALGKIQAILAEFIERRINSFGSEEQLARQLLKGLITPEGLRRICPLGEVCARAAQFGSPLDPAVTEKILERLINERIVRQDADTLLYELRHDSLARTIHEWMTGRELEMMEVRQNIENRFREYRQRGVLLDGASLAYIAPYAERLGLSGELREFIEKSRKEVSRKKQSVLFGICCVLTLMLLTVSILGIMSHRNAIKALEQEQLAKKQEALALSQKSIAEQELVQARHNFGLALLEKAKNAQWNRDGNRAVLYARAALDALKPDASRQRRACQTILVNADISRPIYLALDKKFEKTILTSAALSPDGTRLAYGGAGNTIIIADLATGKILTRLQGHTERVTGITFSPDEKRLASFALDGTIILWDPGIGKQLFSLQDRSLFPDCNLVFSPDGTLLATGTVKGAIHLWDLSTKKQINSFNDHSRNVTSIAFSPDGKILASGAMDGDVILRDLVSGKLKKKLSGHSTIVDALAFSPDGKQIASGGWDKQILIRDVSTGQRVNVLKGHRRSVFSVAFSPNGNLLASGASDGSIFLWNIVTGEPVKILRGHSGAVLMAAFSPDGRTLTSASFNDSIVLWDLANGAPFTRLIAHSGSVESAAFSPDGKYLATGSGDKNIILWDLASNRPVGILQGHTDVVTSVAFSPDGKTLASGSWDDTILLWDLEHDTPIHKLKGHKGKVTDISWSPDGKNLASASNDKTLIIWDTTTGIPVQTLKHHSGRVTCVAWSPDGKQLASGSADNTVILWDRVTASPLCLLPGHSLVTSLAFTGDGTTLAAGYGDAGIALWNPKDGTKQPVVLKGHSGMIVRLAFSPDNTTLAAGTTDNTVVLWDIGERAELTALQGHLDTNAAIDSVRTVSFSPDGRKLATGATDGAIVLWNIKAVKDRLNKPLQDWENTLHLHLAGLDAVPLRPDTRQLENSVPQWASDHPFHWLAAINPNLALPGIHVALTGREDKRQAHINSEALERNDRKKMREENKTDILRPYTRGIGGIGHVSVGSQADFDINTTSINSINKKIHLSLSRGSHVPIDSVPPNSPPINLTKNVTTKGKITTVTRKEDEAMLQLGIIYHRDGEYDKAELWYSKARKAGNSQAAERLAILQKTRQLEKKFSATNIASGKQQAPASTKPTEPPEPGQEIRAMY